MFTDKPAQAKTSEKEEGMGVQSGGEGGRGGAEV